MKELIVLIIVVVLWPGFHAQIIEEDDEVPLMLQDIIRTLDEMNGKLNDMESKLANIDDIKIKVSSIEDNVQVLQGRLNTAESLQNSTADELRNVSSTVHQCSEVGRLITRDECRDGGHNCSALASCVDEPFGYKCRCNKGYSGNGFTCLDIDECRKGGACSKNADCNNTVGSFNCFCKEGYEGDGQKCVPECPPPGVSFGKHGCFQLVTREVTWDAAERICNELGMRRAEDISATLAMDLEKQYRSQLTSTTYVIIGAKSRKWLTSGQEIPQHLYRTGQPNGGRSECLYQRLKYGEVGIWDDICSVTHFPLCQSIP